MLDESMPSIWASVHGWFTPTVLFVILNLVIGTIAVTSKALRSSAADDHAGPSKLARAPSLVLDRLRSFNLNLHRSHSPDPPLQSVPAPPNPETLESFIASPDPTADGGEEMPDLHLGRSQSDERPKAVEVPEKLARAKSAFAHFEEKEIAPPPAPAVESAEEEDGAEGGGEVDARADDFINRFRHQLKLQRLDSFLRYKEMLNRGR